MQEIAWTHDKKNVSAGEKREYGNATLDIVRHAGDAAHMDQLLDGLGDCLEIYMSHGDKLASLPTSFKVTATTTNAPFAGIAHQEKPIFGIQWHPEVTHSARGNELLRNFAVDTCHARQHWTMEEFAGNECKRIRAMVGEKGQVIGAVSGGVDSTVAAKLMNEAIGDRFHAVLVDNGLLRLNEAETVHETLTKHLGINLTVVNAKELFLASLRGVTDPEKKRKAIGANFIQVFQDTAKRIQAEAENSPRAGQIEWLLQGTLYPDVIESISFKGPSQTIKSHHNVGGLPSVMDLKLIEPLRELFKDEVRILGARLGIPEDLVWRHPFPGPGLAIRVLEEVTDEKLEIARQADHIFIEEIRRAGLYGKISQAYAAITPAKAVGVQGDQRVYGYLAVLRAVETTDFMTADVYYFEKAFLKRVSSRITNEIQGITRVTYDLTSKPPGTIEME